MPAQNPRRLAGSGRRALTPGEIGERADNDAGTPAATFAVRAGLQTMSRRDRELLSDN